MAPLTRRGCSPMRTQLGWHRLTLIVMGCFNFPWQFSKQWNESPCSQSSSQSGCCIRELLVPLFAISEEAPSLIMKKDTALCGSMEMFSSPHKVLLCRMEGVLPIPCIQTESWRVFLSDNLDFVFQLHYLSHRRYCFSLHECTSANNLNLQNTICLRKRKSLHGS